MFGYVKPIRCKLDDDIWQQYRAAYCGLCHTLGARYGFFARFIVNYDLTFLSLLLFSLHQDGTCPETTMRRCVASPFRKRCVCATHQALENAADASIVLFWWQLLDSITDKGIVSSIPYRMLCVIFRRAYRNAETRLPAFADQVQNCILQLQELERDGVDSIDRPADTFARILESLASLSGDEKKIPFENLLYHLGRFIYIIDAWDDLEEDFKARRYNPVAKRFSISSGVVSDAVKNELEQTLCHSISEIKSAFAALDCTSLRPLIENVIDPGLYSVLRQVSSGEKPKKEQRIHEGSVSGVGCFARRK